MPRGLMFRHGDGGTDREVRNGRAAARAEHEKRDRPQAAPVRVDLQFSVQTLIDFMPVSASVRVLNVPLSTTVVVVVVGFLSTMVHFLVDASRTT
jgi:hypothetical protein